jgi:cytochrome c biogenesis protein CcmG/thiol:disulfide interchange protein DsbE
MAPDFTLNDASGRPVNLSDFRGKVVLLNFWATWCPPCKDEIPWFIEFQQKYADQGFAVLGVSLDEEGWKAVQPFMQEVKVNYPMMIGNGEVAGLFGGIQSLPTTLLIDRAGRIASTRVGLVRKSDYQAAIESRLNH